MQIRPYEGQLLQVLLGLIGARRVVEIGSFMGYSTMAMAMALPEGGTVLALEKNPDYAALIADHAQKCGVADKVQVRSGDAMELLADIPASPLWDAVFIDAEKRAYPDYLQRVEPLIRPGGLIIGDNTLLFGAMVGEPKQKVSAEATQAMRDFNARLADSSRYRAVLIPTEEGLTVAQKLC